MITLFILVLTASASDRPLSDLKPGTPLLIKGSLPLNNGMWKYHKKGQYLDQSYSYEWNQKLLKPEEGECKLSLWKMKPGIKSLDKISIQSNDLVISESPETSLIAQKRTKTVPFINSDFRKDYYYKDEFTGFTEVSIYLPVKTKDGQREGSFSCQYFTENPPKGKLSTGIVAQKTKSIISVGELPSKSSQTGSWTPIINGTGSSEEPSAPGY